jgi:hypothetical protein
MRFDGGFSAGLIRTEPDTVVLPFELETEADYYDFGELDVDSTTIWEFKIYNTGRRYAVLDTLWFEGSKTAAFSCPLELPLRINPLDTCLVPVSFQPSADTSYAAVLVIPYGDRQALRVLLDGNGYINSAPEEPNVPYEFVLYEAYPNPFNSTVSIRYQLPEASHVKLKIFDISGREAASLVNSKVSAGYHTATWEAKHPSGIYICRMEAGSFSQSRKLILVR